MEALAVLVLLEILGDVLSALARRGGFTTAVRRNRSPLFPRGLPVEDLYTKWCREHGCHHAHCPRSCEHPQPFVATDGRLYCGRCFFVNHTYTEMEPCNPEVCDDKF
jgi:hypothetical protein